MELEGSTLGKKLDFRKPLTRDEKIYAANLKLSEAMEENNKEKIEMCKQQIYIQETLKADEENSNTSDNKVK